MHSSRRNTSGNLSQTIDSRIDKSIYQESPPVEWLRKSGAGGAIFIGSEVDDLAIRYTDYLGRKSLPALTNDSYGRPPRYLLNLIDVAYIFGVDDPRRMQQLAWCCEHRRAYGTCKIIFGYSFCSGRKAAELNKMVEGYGARFFPLARPRISRVEKLCCHAV